MFRLAILAVALSWVPAAAQEEAAPLVKVGDRVRLTDACETHASGHVTCRRTSGVVQLVGQGRITLDVEDERRIWSYVEVSDVELWDGRRGHTLTGLAVGMLSGTLLGAGICAAACQEGFFEKDESIGMAAVGGAAVGFVLGGIVGTVIRTDRWTSASLPARTPVVTIRPRLQGVAVALRLRLRR